MKTKDTIIKDVMKTLSVSCVVFEVSSEWAVLSVLPRFESFYLFKFHNIEYY